MNPPARTHAISIETGLYGLAFILALGLRIWNLAQAPLSDNEAAWALQALQVARGESQVIGANPGYILLTGALFQFFGAGNGLSRLLAALSGSLLVWAPYLFSRPKAKFLLDWRAGLLLAFGLAIDPGLVVNARLAASPMTPVSLVILAAGLWLAPATRPGHGRAILAGTALGLAWLSGATFLPLVMCLAVAWLATCSLVQRLGGKPSDRSATGEGDCSPCASPEAISQSIYPEWKPALLAVLVTLGLAGTLFLQAPNGLAGWAQQIPSYFTGWIRNESGAQTVPALRLLAILVLYQPLALIFGLANIMRSVVGLIQKKPNFSSIFLAMWLLTALFMQILYPARQTTDLCWVLVPLWGLAALELSCLWAQRRSHPVAIAQALITLILLGLLWFNLAAMTKNPTEATDVLARGLILLGILALIGLLAALILLGWDWEISRSGLAFGMAGALALYMLSTLWGSAYLRFNQPQELWFTSSGTGQVADLLATLDTVAEWHTVGDPQTLTLQVTTTSPSLRWALRSYRSARYGASPTSVDLPAVVITPADQTLPALASAYRGQDFVWTVTPGWTGALPPTIVNWLVFRDMPVSQEKVILWTRADLFPGGSTENP